MSEDNPKQEQLDEYHRQVVQAYMVRDFKKAESIMDKMVELAPDDLKVYYFRADFYESLKQPDEAIAEYNKTIALDPQDAYRYAVFAEFFARRHQADNALFNYDKAVELNPPLGLLGRADFYDSIGRIDQALADYNKVVELEPKNIEPYLARSLFYQKQLIPEKLELALKDAQTSCELQPENHSGYFRKGLVLLDLHRYSESSQSFEIALKNKTARLKAAGGALAEFRTDYLIKFYLEWAAGLAAYYQADDPNQAMSYFLQAKYTFEGVPADLKDNYNILYITGLLDAYLKLIPLDNELKRVLSEPDKLPQRTEFLDGLRESFSGMLKISNGLLVEIDMLLEAKRDICALLLPLPHPQAVKPANTEDIIDNTQGVLEYLKYEHTAEIIRILKDNRQKLEEDKPFTKEITKMGDMADGMMTFGTSGSSISDKMGELIKIPEEEEVEMTVDPVTKELIPSKIRRKYRYVFPSDMAFHRLVNEASKPSGPRPKRPITPQVIDVAGIIREIRRKAGTDKPVMPPEVTFHFLRSNREAGIEALAGSTWEKVGIYSPAQLDFVHPQNGEVLPAWRLLAAIAVIGPDGYPPPDANTKVERRKVQDAFRKQIDALNEKLCRLLGLSEKPLFYDRAKSRYFSALKLVPAKENLED